ncbi:uncharacterized protein L199_001366 [Kwoniella botswanensis]|uniref:uncharacterized protein n=1 Tax=Kwoniella botswanensis TaxID=1268659 RepID=UPI00315D7867
MSSSPEQAAKSRRIAKALESLYDSVPQTQGSSASSGGKAKANDTADIWAKKKAENNYYLANLNIYIPFVGSSEVPHPDDLSQKEYLSLLEDQRQFRVDLNKKLELQQRLSSKGFSEEDSEWYLDCLCLAPAPSKFPFSNLEAIFAQEVSRTGAREARASHLSLHFREIGLPSYNTDATNMSYEAELTAKVLQTSDRWKRDESARELFFRMSDALSSMGN